MSVDAGDANDSANPGGGISANLFTQDQVNHFAGQARRGAVATYFKDLGIDAPPAADDLKAALGKAAEYDKLQAGQKSDTERLTTELGAEKEKSAKVPTLEAKLTRAEIAADAGLKPRYWKYIEGDTADDIKASVKDILADVGSGGTGEGASDDGDKQDQQQSGSGRPAPNPQQGRPGGGAPAKSLKSGAEAYKAKHNKE